MLANDTATTQATDQIGQDRFHYLRLTSPVNPEALSTYPRPQDWWRGNPYYKPGTYDQLRSGLPVFNGSECGPTGFPSIPPSPYLAEEFRNRIIQYVLNGGNTVAPPCREQTPFTEGGQSTSYPHVRPDPKPTP
jgi:phospholipid/cholesterol/gamma-HCH transport system substrate-binding protein